jgi:hypothetical protein
MTFRCAPLSDNSLFIDMPQTTLFLVMDAVVRSSASSKEATLRYFARIVSLNVKRRGLRVSLDKAVWFEL